MSATIFFPTRDICHEHPSAHDVFESRVQTLQTTLNILKTLNGLRVSIIDADNLTVITKGRRSGDVDTFADADGAGIADDRLPLGAGSNLLSFNHSHEHVRRPKPAEYRELAERPYLRLRPKQSRNRRQSNCESIDLSCRR